MSINRDDYFSRERDYSGTQESENHMRRLSIRKNRRVCLIVGLFLLLGSTFLLANDDKKKSAPPPPAKAAAPAKPAASAPARPASGSNPGGTRAPSTTTGRPGPTTSNPGNHPGAGNGSSKTPVSSTTNTHTANPSAPAKVPNGSHQTQLKTGSSLQKRSNGKLSDVHDAKRGMDIHHGLNGHTRVSVERPDHSRIVAERGRPGYVQRSYTHNGHAYAARTYYYNGRSYNRVYNVYPYRGVYLNVYAPGFYYAPAFYGWVYNPWYQPVYFSWGWAGNPWYGYYGFYFAPSPFYPSASLWLTDYMISSDLSASYQEQQANGDAPADQPAASGTPALTPGVKDMIAAEVKNQLALENQEATQNAQNQDPEPGSSSINRLLSDHNTHVFVVGSPLDVVDNSGAECALSDGDVLNMVAPAAADATSVSVVVLSSKGGRECVKSATVTVAITDLQDMQNHMREAIDQGMQELQTKQGQGGLPAAPPSAIAPGTNSTVTKDAPPPDTNVSTEVNQQLADATQAEKEVVAQAQQETAPPSSTPAAGSTAPSSVAAASSGPATITVGQTIDEVTAILGSPVTVIDLGPKKIYKYQDMKVTFKEGKVADVD